MNLKNVTLPGIDDRRTYNCFEQQVMTLACFFYQEHWKLFLENSFPCADEDCKFIEEVLVIYSPIALMAEKYYGFSWEKMSSDSPLTFAADELYMIQLNVKDYPFTREIRDEGEHYFIIYGKTPKGYIVNDNYYHVTDYILDENHFAKINKNVYKIRRQENFKPIQDCKEQVIQKLKNNYYDQLMKVVEFIKEKNVNDYHSGILIEKIQIICSFIKKDILIIENNNVLDPYMKECINILEEVVDRIREVWFSFIKDQLKSTISLAVMLGKFEEICRYLTVEKQIKTEICSLMLGQNSLKERLQSQLLEYLEVLEVEDSRSVYQDHAGLAVMYLLNHWEEQNDSQELNFFCYEALKTYGQYKLLTYRNILRSGFERR